MATQATTVAAFQLLCAEVSDALAAGDFLTATSKYAQAEAVNAALDLEVGSEGISVRRRASLDGLAKAIDIITSKTGRANNKNRMITSKTGFQR